METNNIFEIPGVSYSRTGAAPAWRKDGTLVEFAPNVPRITDAGVTIEGQRTNLLLNSALAGGATVTSWGNKGSDAGLAFGSDVARRRLFSASGGLDVAAQHVSMAANTTYTFSLYLEDVSGGIVAGQVATIFNAGAVSYPVCAANPNGGLAGVATNGRLVIQVTPTSASTPQIRMGVGVQGTSTTASVVLSLPQLELGTRASTPIITTGAAATVGADNLALGGLGSVLAAPFSVVARTGDVHSPAGAIPTIFSVSDGTNSNRYTVFRTGSGYALYVSSAGSAMQTPSVPVAAGIPVKVAISSAGNTTRWAINGALAPPLTATRPVGVNKINIGRGDLNVTSGVLDANMQSTTLFPFALTDAELVEMTK